MEEIKCPRCGTVFKLDESAYYEIAKQVRDTEFEKDVDLRVGQLQIDQESAVKLAKADAEKDYTEKLSAKDREIAELKARIQSYGSEKELAVTKAVAEKDREITELNSKVSEQKLKSDLSERSLKERYEAQLKAKDEQVEFYKDFKARQSTKAVGESLERFCREEFDKVRAAAFPTAYFEKDNDARTGSKGDFIFRDSEDGVEYVSIMFEMKNELDGTAAKHRNEDFFKELDRDRSEKGCEYAVLVTMLEPDSELYNTGIVDVSHRYPEMYVIRPQFFIPMITLIRNTARNSLDYRRELSLIREQNIDISHFEDDMNEFRDRFQKNYVAASKKFAAAIEEIDKSIDHLQKIRDNLLSSDRQLRLANDKAQDLTIKKLTRNNRTMARKFGELEKGKHSGTDPDASDEEGERG